MNDTTLARSERKTFRKLRHIITSIDGATDIKKCDVLPDTPFASFNFDSLCMIEICTAIEKRLNVHVNATELQTMNTCADAVKYITRLQIAKNHVMVPA